MNSPPPASAALSPQQLEDLNRQRALILSKARVLRRMRGSWAREGLVLLLLVFLGCTTGVPLKRLLPMEAELVEQAGVAYVDRALLQELESAAHNQADRAEVARRRCALEHAALGPAAALPWCQRAVILARPLAGDPQRKAQRRLSQVLSAAGRGHDALRTLDGAPASPEPLEQALMAYRAMGQHQQALQEAMKSSRAVEEAVRRNQSRAEFGAILAWQVGRCLATVGRQEEAQSTLRQGIALQRQLDSASEGYAEYRLYLVRLLREAGRLPGGLHESIEAERLLTGTIPKDISPQYRLVRDMLDWVIVGGESGPGARRCEVGWIRDIVRECRGADVAVFVKQLGARPVVVAPPPGGHSWKRTSNQERLKLRNRKGGDPEEWPEDLRVREFPKQ